MQAHERAEDGHGAAEDVTFVFARLKSARRQRLRAAGLIALVGENRVYLTVRAAVEAVSTNSPTRAASPVRDEEVKHGCSLCISGQGK